MSVITILEYVGFELDIKQSCAGIHTVLVVGGSITNKIHSESSL